MKLPPYDIYPSLSDGKILLRQIMPSDISGIVEISFYDGVRAQTVDEAAAMQERIDEDVRNGNSIHWGIADTTTNKLIGTCGYYRGFDKGEGELGCVLLPQFRGQGLMRSALQLAIDFGLNNMGLKRIWAVTTTDNTKAILLLERLQFVKVSDLEGNKIEYELTMQRP